MIDNYIQEQQLEYKEMFNTYSSYQKPQQKDIRSKQLYFRPMSIEIDVT